MNWGDFKRAVPELAEEAEKLFDRAGVILLGTVRKDGSPRISPVEPVITEGHVYLGMIWQSLKALDLLRDARCTVHSCISDRMAPEGEFKLHGKAIDIQDEDERARYGDALYEKIGWRPSGTKWHLFSIEVQSAALFHNEKTYRRVKRWRAGQDLEEFKQTV